MNTGKLQIVPPQPSESPQLLERCQKGEREALGEFYRLYRPEVVRNLAFGGPDFRTLYLTPGGSLAHLEVTTPGIGPGH